MPRIAKSDVNAALSLAARSIITAGGEDGRTSRAEMKAALATMPKEERALADIFFKFVDHRDFKAGAQVTAKDVNKAVAYAKEHMVAKYDLNSNGLSKDEIAKMSLTGRNAVALAKALKSAAVVDEPKLGTAQLKALVSANKADALYMSEGDSHPQFIAAPLSSSGQLTGPSVMSALSADLTKFFKNNQDGRFPADFSAKLYSAAEGREFIDTLRTPDTNIPNTDESADAFTRITDGLLANLTDVKVVKIGPKASDGSLAMDQGLYAKLVVGRTADGKLAGILLGSVET